MFVIFLLLFCSETYSCFLTFYSLIFLEFNSSSFSISSYFIILNFLDSQILVFISRVNWIDVKKWSQFECGHNDWRYCNTWCNLWKQSRNSQHAHKSRYERLFCPLTIIVSTCVNVCEMDKKFPSIDLYYSFTSIFYYHDSCS